MGVNAFIEYHKESIIENMNSFKFCEFILFLISLLVEAFFLAGEVTASDVAASSQTNTGKLKLHTASTIKPARNGNFIVGGLKFSSWESNAQYVRIQLMHIMQLTTTLKAQPLETPENVV